MRVELVLSEEQVEVIARRVAELLAGESQRPAAGSPFVTVAEAAELLRCSRQRVDNLLSAGRLRRVKDGRRTLIERAELERYLAGAGARRVAHVLPAGLGSGLGSGVAG